MTEDSGRGHVQPQQPSYSCCDIGHSLEVVGCVVFVVLGASGGDGRPPFTKDEQYAQRLRIGFVASVFRGR